MSIDSLFIITSLSTIAFLSGFAGFVLGRIVESRHMDSLAIKLGKAVKKEWN